MARILSAWEETFTEYGHHAWIQKKQTELIAAIPCYLRSLEAQAVMDAYEKSERVLVRQPNILSRSGTVSARFHLRYFLVPVIVECCVYWCTTWSMTMVSMIFWLVVNERSLGSCRKQRLAIHCASCSCFPAIGSRFPKDSVMALWTAQLIIWNAVTVICKPMMHGHR